MKIPRQHVLVSLVSREIFHQICYRDIDNRKPESERVKEREDWSCKSVDAAPHMRS